MIIEYLIEFIPMPPALDLGFANHFEQLIRNHYAVTDEPFSFESTTKHQLWLAHYGFARDKTVFVDVGFTVNQIVGDIVMSDYREMPSGNPTVHYTISSSKEKPLFIRWLTEVAKLRGDSRTASVSAWTNTVVGVIFNDDGSIVPIELLNEANAFLAEQAEEADKEN